MIGDFFVVYTVNKGEAVDSYSHCTVYKTLIDYMTRLADGELAMVAVDTKYGYRAVFSNPLMFYLYLKENFINEINENPKCSLLFENLSHSSSFAFILGYWGGHSNCVVRNPAVARGQINESDWLSLILVIYPTLGTPTKRLPCTNRLLSIIATESCEVQDALLRQNYAILV